MNLNAIAVRLAAAAAALALGSMLSYVAVQAAPRAKVVKINAKRFVFGPNHLTLKKGEAVEIELTSSDILMGFNLPDFGVRGDIVPEKVTRIRFVPDKTGTFTFLCDIFCGDGHERMQGTITVVD
jgi:cytochrome c oxidase subunit 2